MSDSVIRALQAALEANPADQSVREHLATLLLDAGRGGEALELLQTWLARDPTSQVALALGVRAADMAGEAATANAYQTMLNALYQFQDRSEQALMREVRQPVGKVSAEGHSPPPPEYWVNPHEEKGAPEQTPGQGGLTSFQSRWQPVGGNVTLKDVVGMTDLKARLERSLLGPLRHPELARAYGKQSGGGMLLYGPPGCGKTHLARAIAGELGASFLEVTVADILDMWLGNAERNIRELFVSARQHAPCVVFFDEVDALGRGRQLNRNSSHSVTQTLLRELDGMEGRSGVFVLAATNAPWDVDTALKRPGRLGANLLVPPPDLAAREAMFREFMRECPTDVLDAAWLARQTELFSGADIRQVCQEASELALARALKRGGLQPVSMADFREALRILAPSTREWLVQARNHVVYANEGGSYDELAALLREKKLL